MSEYLYEKAENVKTKEDLIEFVKLLEKDFIENKKKWENCTVDGYLESISAWTEDTEKFFLSDKENKIAKNIPWGIFAQLLHSGKIYE